MKSSATYGLGHQEEQLSWLSVQHPDSSNWLIEHHGQIPVDGPVSLPVLDGLPEQVKIGTGILPSANVKTAVTKLPRLRGKEMERAVCGWAARTEKVPVDDLAVTWRVIDEDDASLDPQVTVFMAYIAKSEIQATMAKFSLAGLEPEVLLPDFMILDQLLRSTRPELAELKAWSFVHLDNENSFLCISGGKGPLLHRSLPRDLSRGANESEYICRLTTEISRSISFARQTEQNPDIGGILVSGDKRLADQLYLELQSSQPLPVTKWGIEDLLQGSDPAPDTASTMPIAAAIITSLGHSHFNFLPRKRKGLMSARVRRQVMTGVAVVSALLIPIFVITSVMAERRSAERLDWVVERWEAIQPAIASATETGNIYSLAQSREMTIREHMSGADGLENLLAKLADCTPPQVRFASLKIMRQQDAIILQISGESVDDQNAGAQQAFLKFVAALDGSQYLERSKQQGKLIIGENGRDDTGAKRVVFSLEYLVDNDIRREG